MRALHFILMVMVVVSIQSCYTFTGSSLSPEVKTCAIENFPNYSALQNPNLSQDFTTSLQNRFSQRTKLNMVSSDGDINIEGEISDYTISSETTTSDNLNAQNRLTIQVSVRYENKKDPDKSFDKTFSDYETYDADAVQPSDQIVNEVINRVIDQIFYAIVAADW